MHSWPSVRGIHRWLLDAPHSDIELWCFFFLVVSSTTCWTNSEVASDTRRHDHYDGISNKNKHMVLLCFVLLYLFHWFLWINMIHNHYDHLYSLGCFTGTGAIMIAPVQSSRMYFMLRLPNCTDKHQMLIILTNPTSDIWIQTKQTCWRDFGKTAQCQWHTHRRLPQWH